MATVSRFNAVCQIGKLEFGGFLAWLAWLGLHLYYLVGSRNRLVAVYLVVRHLPRQRPRPDGDHRTVGVRAQGDGASPQEQSAQKSHWMTRVQD